MNGPSIFSVLKGAMGWHQARQRVLAENVANANTVGYRASDLKPLDFSSRLSQAPAAAVRLTDARHMAGAGTAASGFERARAESPEMTPDGNGVVLEEQMMKLTGNQMDYEMAATLYQKSLGLIRTALSRR